MMKETLLDSSERIEYSSIRRSIVNLIYILRNEVIPVSKNPLNFAKEFEYSLLVFHITRLRDQLISFHGTQTVVEKYNRFLKQLDAEDEFREIIHNQKISILESAKSISSKEFEDECLNKPETSVR